MDVTIALESASAYLAMDIATIAIGEVFAFAALAKCMDFSGIAEGIRSYGIAPGNTAAPTAALLILTETTIAVTHLGAIALHISVPATIVLLVAFLLLSSVIVARGRRQPCLCFGADRQDSVDVHSLARILILLTVEVSLYFALVRSYPSDIEAVAERRDLEAIAVASLIVLLTSWCFSVPKFVRAYRVIKT